MSTPQPRELWTLDTTHVGRVLVFDRLESTNTTAAGLAGTGPDVILADHQTAGRGQYGRVWQSRPGASLLMSAVLRPPPELCRPVILTALALVAVGDAVFRLAELQARVKWPNDLLVRGKKVCGILIENTGPTVVGIGLNLNQTAEEFADSGLPDATSLRILTDRYVDVRTAAEVVIRRIDAEYERLLGGERVAVEADWKWRVGLLGRQVVVERADGTRLTGRLREMSFEGLELETTEGVQVIIPETVRQVTPTDRG